MFRLFKSNRTNKLKKQYSLKLKAAMEAQRSGDIRRYSELSEEAEAILAEIDKADDEQKSSG